MSRKGNCWDNATLKREHVFHNRYLHRVQARHGRAFLCTLNSFTIVSVSIQLLDIEHQAK